MPVLMSKRFSSGLRKGKVDHDIWYEEIPIENPPHSLSSPGEVLVYFDGCDFDEGWEHDFQWTDPVGRRALIPEKFYGVVRPPT